MAKLKIKYICQECGYETGKWLGKCPSCGNFNTFCEEFPENSKFSINSFSSINTNVQSLNEIENISEERTKTNICELDRVLGGGIVKGSLTLVGGDPGIGKSTLLIQLCQSLGNNDKTILYVSGEESAVQIKMRAERLKITTSKLYLLPETNFEIIENTINNMQPDLVIIDSIQTMFINSLASAPGSVTQVRECTSRLMRLSKGKNISIFVVGHVTKDGAIAGPRVLEHMVDTVLYFEGERKASYRMLRAVKNRFGSTNEIGVFEMHSDGLVQIENPSEYMLSGRPLGVSGSAVTCSIEGTRPILTEVQALVSYTNFGIPRRIATGMDFNRVTLIIAVLEKRIGLKLGNYDSYVNIAGGMKIVEPALDASVATAISSAYKNRPIDPYTLIFGEIGLTGEIRAVSSSEKRVMEASKLGFKSCILPMANLKEVSRIKGINIFPVKSVLELLDKALT